MAPSGHVALWSGVQSTRPPLSRLRGRRGPRGGNGARAQWPRPCETPPIEARAMKERKRHVYVCEVEAKWMDIENRTVSPRPLWSIRLVRGVWIGLCVGLCDLREPERPVSSVLGARNV